MATNNTAKLSLGPLGYVGAATTKVSSTKTSSTRASVTTTKVATTSLLGGLVQAQAITASATVAHSSKGYAPSGSSVFTGLRIGGRAISATPKPTTTVEVPGLATVVLKSTGTSTDTTATTVAATTNSVAEVDLLSGVVTIDAVDVSATATRKGKAVALSSTGTKIAVAGVRTLYLRKVT